MARPGGPLAREDPRLDRNTAQIVDLSWAEWLTHKDDEGVFEEIRRDGIDVTPKTPSVVSLIFPES